MAGEVQRCPERARSGQSNKAVHTALYAHEATQRISHLKRNMSLLWTFYDHPETGLPNTNNALEGVFSDLKNKVRAHRGISKENRKKLLDEYIKRHY